MQIYIDISARADDGAFSKATLEDLRDALQATLTRFHFNTTTLDINASFVVRLELPNNANEEDE